MAKKKKRTGRKRNLKYGNIAVSKSADLKNQPADASSKKTNSFESETNPEFKKELRKNLLFVGGFFLVLVILYLTLTKTTILNPLFSALGLEGLYN